MSYLKAAHAVDHLHRTAAYGSRGCFIMRGTQRAKRLRSHRRLPAGRPQAAPPTMLNLGSC